MPDFDLTEEDYGSFVVANAEYGIGRLTEIKNTETAVIRYFRQPSKSPFVSKEFPLEEVRLVTLTAHTRVYKQNEYGWDIARVIEGEHAHERKKVVICPPGPGENPGETVNESEIEVRWLLPIEDPFEMLSVFTGESPRVVSQCRPLLNNFYAQKYATSGIEGLFKSCVRLHPHQISCVQKISSDDTKRYILADEVGLGKTIEACAVISQYRISNPSASLAVLVPGNLKNQWEKELQDKFFIFDAEIISHEEVESRKTGEFEILVIDEAHRLTRSETSDQNVIDATRGLAHKAGVLLLLSATPVRSNETGFLDLLNMLDPVNYDHSDSDGFRELVESRDKLASYHNALGLELDEDELKEYLEAIAEEFPDDTWIQEYLSSFSKNTDLDVKNAADKIRYHLSETYRIHHRLIRTRRAPGINEFVRGRERFSPFQYQFEDKSTKTKIAIIEEFMQFLVASLENESLTLEETLIAVRECLSRCGSLTSALLSLYDDQSADSEVSVFANWIKEFENWHAELRAESHNLSSTVAKYLVQNFVSKGKKKIVLFSSYPEVIEELLQSIQEIWAGPNLSVLHLNSFDENENDNSIEKWLSNDQCRFLFCDTSAEEGKNLQRADLIIHLDLPWEILRLEQRIGRCDRFDTASENKEPIPSQILQYGEQDYADNWFIFLADACDIFEESISTLQYVLTDSLELIHENLLKIGLNSLVEESFTFKERLLEERKKINNQDALDSFDFSRNYRNANILEIDSTHSLVYDLKEWLKGVNVKHYGVDILTFDKRSLTSEPQISFSLARKLRPFFGDEFASHREAAVHHHRPLLCAGNTFVDSIIEDIQKGDRGKVPSLFMRNIPNAETLEAYFFLLFYVEPVIPNDLLIKSAEIGYGKWINHKILELVPPRIEKIMFREGTDGKRIILSGELPPIFAAEYESFRDGGRDYKLSGWGLPATLYEITREFEWDSICDNGLKICQKSIKENREILEIASQASVDLRTSLKELNEREIARSSSKFTQKDSVDIANLLKFVPETFEMSSVFLSSETIFVGDASKYFPNEDL